MARKSFCFISVHSAPYRDPLLFALQDSPNIDLNVITLNRGFVTHNEWNYGEQYDRTSLIKSRGNIRIFLELISYIKITKASVVLVPGHYPLYLLLLMAYLVFKKIPYIYAADTVEYYGRKKFWFVTHYFILHAHYVFVPGVASRNFMIKNKVSSDKILDGLYTFDNDKIVNSIRTFRSTIFEQHAFNILFVGKLLSSRNIGLLLEAFSLARRKNDSLSLTIIGDGPDSKVLEKYTSEWRGHAIEWIKSVPFSQLHKYYAKANAYIHLGSEPYSLALVEALLAELPIITTRYVGASYDCVEHGVNGFIVDQDNIHKIVDTILMVAAGAIKKDDLINKRDNFCKNKGIEAVCRQIVSGFDAS